MTSVEKRSKLFAALGLLVLGTTLWLNPVARYRAYRSEEAVRRDPFAGASVASSTAGDSISARIVDQVSLRNALDTVRKITPGMAGTASFAVLVDADGNISDLRFLDGTLHGTPLSSVIAALEGAQIYVPVAGAMTVRTVLGPVDVTTSAVSSQ